MKTVATEHKRVDLRRNDTVKVITGRDKGKEGRVLRVFPNDAKILVEHVMLVKKHVRPNPQRNVKGGIAEQESRITCSTRTLASLGKTRSTRPSFPLSRPVMTFTVSLRRMSTRLRAVAAVSIF